jgi:hypothetical protein
MRPALLKNGEVKCWELSEWVGGMISAPSHLTCGDVTIICETVH